MEQSKWVPNWKLMKIAIGGILLVKQRQGGLKQHVQNLPSLARKRVAQVLRKHLYLEPLVSNPKHWMSSPHRFTMGFFLVSRNCFLGLPFSIWEKRVNVIHSQFFFLLDTAELQNTTSPCTLLFPNTFHPIRISTLQTWVILLWFQRSLPGGNCSFCAERQEKSNEGIMWGQYKKHLNVQYSAL